MFGGIDSLHRSFNSSPRSISSINKNQFSRKSSPNGSLLADHDEALGKISSLKIKKKNLIRPKSTFGLISARN
jgi:hypothetical protein